CLLLPASRAVIWALVVVAVEGGVVALGVATGSVHGVTALGVDLALGEGGRLPLLVACAVAAIGVLALAEELAEPSVFAALLAGLAGVALAAITSTSLLAAGPALILAGLAVLGTLGSRRAATGL